MNEPSAVQIALRALLAAGLLFAGFDALPAQRVAQQCVLRDGRLTPVASNYKSGPADSVVIFDATADASRRVPAARDVASSEWIVRNGSVPFRDTQYFLWGDAIRTTKLSRLRMVPVGMHDGVRFYVPHPVPEGMVKYIYVRFSDPCSFQPYVEVSEVRQYEPGG